MKDMFTVIFQPVLDWKEYDCSCEVMIEDCRLHVKTHEAPPFVWTLYDPSGCSIASDNTVALDIAKVECEIALLEEVERQEKRLARIRRALL